jgi:hypothetical protein
MATTTTATMTVSGGAIDHAYVVASCPDLQTYNQEIIQ